jgi:hypothetical protein
MKREQLAITLTDLAFGGLIGFSIFALLYLRVPIARIVLYRGVYAPEAYKVIIWSLFALFVLRPKFGVRYFFAFAFIYCLAEDVGNWTYIFVHWNVFLSAFSSNFVNPFPISDPTLTYKYLVFNLVPLLTYPLIRKNLTFAWKGFIPFGLLVFGWLLNGYPLMTDYQLNQTVPPILYVFEVVWTLCYLFGWFYALRIAPNKYGKKTSLTEMFAR